MASTNKLILELHLENPAWSNQQIADEVRARVPGAKTSAASVSSVKSNARKAGDLPSVAESAALNAQSVGPSAGIVLDEDPETPEERRERIKTRYNTLERMARRIAEGGLPAIVIQGPPGLGKSFTVERELKRTKDDGDFDIIKGTVSGPGLYTALWNQAEGGVVVLDDCDVALGDEVCLNLLKTVLDSSEERIVSWRKMARWLEDNDIPDTFEFKGSMVFCTNLDFEQLISKGNARSKHLEALIDRCLYLSLTTRTKDDHLERMRQVVFDEHMLEEYDFGADEVKEIMDFVEEYQDTFYTLSLRLVHQIAICKVADPKNWRSDVLATKTRTLGQRRKRRDTDPWGLADAFVENEDPEGYDRVNEAMQLPTAV